MANTNLYKSFGKMQRVFLSIIKLIQIFFRRESIFGFHPCRTRVFPLSGFHKLPYDGTNYAGSLFFLLLLSDKYRQTGLKPQRGDYL